MKKTLFLFFTFLLFSRISLIAQVLESDDEDTSYASLKEKIAELRGKVDGLNESFLETKSIVDSFTKIKISGYMLAQFQSAQTDGATTIFEGGNYGKDLHNRFKLRENRLRINYDNDLIQGVVTIDISETGLTTKDAFLSITESWLKTFTLAAGVFDRPFGYEISYSSALREAPERSRLFQTLFPGERDLGAKIDINPTYGLLSYFNFKGGLFAGNGIALDQYSNAKDFIGRLGFSFPFQEANLSIDGGISTYQGSVRVAPGKKTYILNSPVKYFVDSTSTYADRKYYGADLEIYYDVPVIGGFSLRGEYISGQQPGTLGTSPSPVSNLAMTNGTDDVYLRNFSGYYLSYVQNIGDKNQFALKYDVFDPNTNVAKDDINPLVNKKLSAADIKWTDLGIGWIYHWDSNIKFTLYYDLISNEQSANLIGYTGKIRDNLMTFRITYRF